MSDYLQKLDWQSPNLLKKNITQQIEYLLRPRSGVARRRFVGDIAPGADWGQEADVVDLRVEPSLVIENLPWNRLLEITDFLVLKQQHDAWLLCPGTTLFNVGFGRLAPDVAEIAPAGRPIWIPGSHHRAKDDVVWIKFSSDPVTGLTVLHCRFTATEVKRTLYSVGMGG